jgi:3-oxoacyl-[acyl-carrier-protein] synthase II
MMEPFDWAGHCVSGRLSTRGGDPAGVVRPFDAGRDGEVYGEGAAAFVLERRSHAEARGAKVLARVLAWSSACERYNGSAIRGTGLERAIRLALEQARLEPDQIGHVNAHGAGTVLDDAVEAQAIHRVLPGVPVTAPKSYFGNLGAAGGAVEMLASVLGLVEGRVPPTLNYERPDPRCPVPVVHGPPLEGSPGTAVLVNSTPIGQAAVVVLGSSS